MTNIWLLAIYKIRFTKTLCYIVASFKALFVHMRLFCAKIVVEKHIVDYL